MEAKGGDGQEEGVWNRDDYLALYSAVGLQGLVDIIY